MRQFLFSVSLFCVLTCSGYAQGKTFDSLVTSGIQQIYRMEFQPAEKTFHTLIADYPEHPAGRFFLAMIDWWKILVDMDNESYDDIFFQKLEDVIFQCDKILDNNDKNVDALFFKGGAIGFRGRLRAIRESWLKAADDGREALPIVEKAAKLDPSNKDVQLGFGIYNYYAAVIPNDYPLIKPLMIFFPSGDKQKGIAQLTETAEYGKYAKYEARYFLMTLYSQYERDFTRAWQYAAQLCNDFPDNPSFEKWKGRIAVQSGNWPEYFNTFQSVYKKGEKNMFGYNVPKAKREAAYYIGLYYRDTRKADSSVVWLKRSEQLSLQADGKEESGYLINTTLYLGMMYDIMGQRDDAIRYYNKVMNLREWGSSRVSAKQYLQSPYKY